MTTNTTRGVVDKLISCRPYKLFQYSDTHGKLTFDLKQLRPCKLLQDLSTKKVSVTEGVQNFTTTVFTKKESKCKNLLLTIIAYESVNDIKHDDTKLEVYCQNGFFSDVAMNTRDKYSVVLYKNKMIIANTSTREGQDRKLSYIGLKFESLLQSEPSPVDTSHTRILLKGNFGKWDYKSVVEIDGYKPIEENGKILNLNEIPDDKLLENLYEVKLNSCYFSDDLDLNDPYKCLRYLYDHLPYFNHKCRKWLYQSYFGRQDRLIIGMRDHSFKVTANFEINVLTDLIPFIEKFCPKIYQEFINSPKKIEEMLDRVYNKVKIEEKKVICFRCDSASFGGRVEFKDMIIPEYLEWVDNGNDILESCPFVDGPEYKKLKDSKLSESLSNLKIT